MNNYPMIPRQGFQELFTVEGLSSAARLHPSLIEYYVDYGLLEPVQILNGIGLFAAGAVPRLRMIQRLRTEAGVSLPGVAIILDLTDKIRRLQYENECLRQDRSQF